MGSLLTRIERVPVGSLSLYPGNARRGDVEAIAASLAENEQYAPLVVQQSTRYVLAGNHTLKAAVHLGWGEIDVTFVDVDDRRAQKIVLSANRTADLADYDEEALVALLRQLGGDFDGTGWAASDLDDLAASLNGGQGRGGGGDPDDVPEPPAEPVSVLGDLYLLGPHRLLCGDATNPDDLKRVTEGMDAVGIVYTDPPYGVDIVSRIGKVGGGGPFGGVKANPNGKVINSSHYRPVAGDETTDVARDAFALQSAEYPDALHVWWGGNHYAASAGLPDSSCWLIWDKENTGNFADAELAWTNHPGAVRLLRHMWNGMVRASERGKRVHPTQKPVALHEWAFSVIDPKDERKLVLDTFAGSGSTLIAAHSTGRTAALIEMEPAYVDVIAERWERATGLKPERVLPDGTTEPVSFQDQS